jgi:hypothetical protein
MVEETTGEIPPLQGCLYCHAEGTTALTKSRRFLGLGSSFPTLKCRHCGAVAVLDLGSQDDSDSWRIRYRRVSRTPRYYYVALHLGKAGWLTAREAIIISTNGYVQRRRVQQVKEGELSWLRPAPLSPPLPLMSPDEHVYLTLRAVTYRQMPPRGVWMGGDPGTILDSGKFYVTDQKLHLLGQRRDWSHDLSDIQRVDYNEQSWAVYLDGPEGQTQQYHGLNVADQLDAQLVASIIDILWSARLNSSYSYNA